MHNQEFVAMPANEVAKLLANDSLNVINEEMVFHALVLWAKHDMAARKKHLSKLLVHIKLPLLSPQVWYSLSVLFMSIVIACHVDLSNHIGICIVYYIRQVNVVNGGYTVML